MDSSKTRLGSLKEVIVVANFQWFLPERIAGGSKPSDAADVEWLVRLRSPRESRTPRVSGQDIRCVLSLETICGLVEQLFAQHKITRLYLPVELQDSEVLGNLGHRESRDNEVVFPTGPELLQGAMFVRVALKAERRVYIHCSTGMLRTPAVAQLIIDRLFAE